MATHPTTKGFAHIDDPADACTEVAGRLEAVRVLLDEVSVGRDPDGWLLGTARDLTGMLQDVLRRSAAADCERRKREAVA
jgi:hypothetical protein